jgi:ribose 5-phosphate isomerase B
MSLRKTSSAVALEILDSWFGTAYQPNPTDDACLAKIAQLDAEKKS